MSLSSDASPVVDAVRAIDGVLRVEAQGQLLRVFSDRGGRVISPVIQAADGRGRIMRYELSDEERSAIRPMLPISRAATEASRCPTAPRGRGIPRAPAHQAAKV